MANNQKFTFRDGRSINRIGFGAMRLTGQPGNYGPFENWEHGIALLRRAHELGVYHIDSARAYGPLFNERLIGEAFAGMSTSERPFIASKGGIEKTGAGSEFIKVDGRPDVLTKHIDESLEALGTEVIDLYYLHRPDPSVPIEESVGALLAAKEAGKILRIGVSNVSLSDLKRAQSVTQIDAVQNRFNVAEENGVDVLSYSTAEGIAFVPWGPLGASPMKHGSPLAQESSGRRNHSGAQIALRSLLERAPNILPIPGTTTIAHLEENVAA